MSQVTTDIRQLAAIARRIMSTEPADKHQTAALDAAYKFVISAIAALEKLEGE